MSHELDKAARATDAIQEHAEIAMLVLDGNFNGRIVNGHGIYVHLERQVAALKSARDALNTALEHAARTKWPTPSEYE